MHSANNAVTPRVGVAALLRRGASCRDRGEEEENILIIIMATKVMLDLILQLARCNSISKVAFIQALMTESVTFSSLCSLIAFFEI